MAAEVITGWINSSGASGGLQYGGTFNREAGDLQIAAYKWDGADTSVTISDTDEATWAALTERLHTAGGSTLRAQVHLAKNVPFANGVNVFSTPAANVPSRELFVAQLRGLVADPMLNADNITYHNAVSGTLSAASSGDPGGDAIVIGILFVTESGRTITPGSGWTAMPRMEGSQEPDWVHMIYKITNATATPQWSVSGGTVVAMSVTLSLEAASGGGGGGGSSYVNAYLVQSARGMTGLTAHVWDGEPHEVLSTRYTGLATQDVTDPGGQPAALIQMTPAPAGTSDGDDVIVAVEDPASNKVSSWRVPGKVVGTSVGPSTALANNDSRRMYLIRADLATTAQVSDALVQISTWGPNPELSTINDTTGDLYGGEVRLKRVNDPRNGARKAFQHAIATYFPTYQTNTKRSEITSLDNYLPGIVPRPGDQFWGWFAIDPDSAAQSTGDISVFDLHAGYPSNNGGPSPFSVILGSGKVSIARSWNTAYNAASSLSRVWYETAIEPNGWTIFFVQIRLHYDIAQGPFLRLWKKRGANSIESVLNINGPIGYNDPNPNCYPKFGAYKWDTHLWNPASATKCTVHHKGCGLYRDAAPASGEPELSLQSLLATVEAI